MDLPAFKDETCYFIGQKDLKEAIDPKLIISLLEQSHGLMAKPTSLDTSNIHDSKTRIGVALGSPSKVLDVKESHEASALGQSLPSVMLAPGRQISNHSEQRNLNGDRKPTNFFDEMKFATANQSSNEPTVTEKTLPAKKFSEENIFQVKLFQKVPQSFC